MNTSDIQRIVANFIPDSDIKLIGTESGEYNKAYLFSTEREKYALRVKKKPVTIIYADVAYEVEFMENLASAQKRIHIPTTIKTVSGDLLFENETAYYNLQTLVPGGRRIDKWYGSHTLSLDDIKEIFSALAVLHNVSRGFHLTNSKKSPTVFEYLIDYRKLLQNKLPPTAFSEVVNKNRRFLEEKLDALEHTLHKLHYENCKKYPTHYDTSAMNVLWEGGKVVSLIDFDWAQDSTLEFDFCHSAMHSCGSYIAGGADNNLFDEEKVKVALESYNKEAKVPFENRELIAALLDASSFFLAFWGLQTFLVEKNRESYYVGFFQSGLDRLKNPI